MHICTNKKKVFCGVNVILKIMTLQNKWWKEAAFTSHKPDATATHGTDSGFSPGRRPAGERNMLPGHQFYASHLILTTLGGK